VIGLLGATGAVGSVVARRLAAAGRGPLRLAARDVTRLQALAGEVPGADVLRCDLDDPGSLAAFCAGCRLVVQCAGPSYQVLGTVARAALAAGAHYVDAAGDRVAIDDLGGAPAGCAVVFSAGLLPGLGGLLPRLLVDGEGSPHCLEVYAGGAVPLTRLSAVDALLTRGPRFGTPFAAWRGGRVVERALSPLRGIHLPGFERPADAIPFLSAEVAALAEQLRVPELRSYAVYPSARLPDAFAMAWADEETSLDDHAGAVMAAADADLAEQEAHFVLLVHTEPAGRRLLMRTADPYGLTGAVTALAAGAVLDGAIPEGIHCAAEVLDPKTVAGALLRDPTVTTLTWTSGRTRCE